MNPPTDAAQKYYAAKTRLRVTCRASCPAPETKLGRRSQGLLRVNAFARLEL